MNQHPRVIYDDAPLPEEPAGFFYPVGEPPTTFAPIASRDELLVAAWRERELPPRDYLSGEVLCSTSRVLLNGATGIGKTLFCLDWGAAIASERYAAIDTRANARPNVALCLGMEKNYNDCLTREARRQRHWRHEREEWGVPWDDDGPPPGENCAAWLLQLKANGCF
ncbi:MAG: AAA family ATPase [Roseiarcus sp.]